MKLPITCIIIAKNESHQIQECIRSLSWSSECIVVDNGSTDNTIEIARKEGAHVFSEAKLSFSQMRNFAASKSKYDWILYVDADERVPQLLEEEIRDVLKKNRSIQYGSYWINRENYYYGNHLWPYKDKHLRLFNKVSLLQWKGELHESPEIIGKTGSLITPLYHSTHRDLHLMVKKTNEWSEIEAFLRIRNHHPQIVTWRMLRVMFTGFWESYINNKGFIVGTIGIIESIYQSFSYFITYAKVWEKQNDKMINKK